MRILITGINGFSGFHLYDILDRKKDEIWGIDKCEKFNNKYDDINIIKCDLTNYSEVEQVIKKIRPHKIYHLAAFVYVGRKDINPDRIFTTNIIGTLNLLRAIQESNIKSRILIVGSAEEYGVIPQEQMPIKEDYSLNPNNLYGVSKKLQEEVGKYYYRIYNYNIEILFTRTFHYCGPFQPKGFVFADFASQVVEIENSDINYIKVGNLKAKRDFTDIRDVVNAYKIIMEEGTPGNVYNVCSGELISIEDILKKFLQYAKKYIKIIIDKKKLRPLDVPIFVGDNSKLKSLGWKRKYNIDDSIKDIINSWRTIKNN